MTVEKLAGDYRATDQACTRGYIFITGKNNFSRVKRGIKIKLSIKNINIYITYFCVQKFNKKACVCKL